jgi:hypothetical protein
MTPSPWIQTAGLWVLAFAAPVGAAEPLATLYDGTDGATCQYFNYGARIPWLHQRGDWVDVNGRSQGESPFARTVIEDTHKIRAIEWDVTALTQSWLSGEVENSGLLLDTVKGTSSGTILFFSKEANPVDQRPRIVLTLAAPTETRTVVAAADTTLDCSTVISLGAREQIHVGGDTRSVLQFDLTALKGRRVTRAVLQLTTTTEQFGAATVGVFRVDAPVKQATAPRQAGIAAAYPRDQGIEKDPDVIMASGFEAPLWRSDWSYVSVTSHVERVDRDDERRFEPFIGHALRVAIRRGDNLGLDMGFNFKDKLGYEPEEMYFRYYLRFGEDWIPSVDGGKLPGFAATYGRAGWGGRKSNGSEGWSMRGLFHRAMSEDNPLYGRTAVGSYAYHAETDDFWGDEWNWTNNGVGVLERNRWYCIEQYVKVNTPGVKDGIVRAWIDGKLAFDKTDVHVRDVSSIKIEKLWMNVYHGGTARAAQDLHLYLDNVVIARRQIGCTAR